MTKRGSAALAGAGRSAIRSIEIDADTTRRLRRQRLIQRIYRLGPRVVFELIDELYHENRDRGAEGEGDFHLFFVDGSPREDPRAGPPASAARPGREPRRRGPYPARHVARPSIRPDHPGAMPDDPIGDIGRGGAP